MKFFKCLLEAVASSSSCDEDNLYHTRFSFKDTTNLEFPRIDIWDNGEVLVYDSEDRVCIASDEMILKYCNMKDDELVLEFDSEF